MAAGARSTSARDTPYRLLLVIFLSVNSTGNVNGKLRPLPFIDFPLTCIDDVKYVEPTSTNQLACMPDPELAPYYYSSVRVQSELWILCGNYTPLEGFNFLLLC